MSSYEGFLQAILAEPDDDTHRLVCADWLEEQGDADRAQFIRLQIEEWKETRGKWGPSRFNDQIMKLYWANRNRWIQSELPTWLHNEHYVEFRRGFAACINTTALRLVQKAEELWQAAPIEKLILRSAGGRVRQVAACPFLARSTELHLMNGVGDEDAIALASSPYLGRLEEVDLSCTKVGDAGAQALAACPGLAGLTKLDLHLTQIGDAGALAIADSPHLTKLEHLDLFCPRISHAVRQTIKQRLGKRVTI
jgi:uncharacterized protein (TIGR02996 family)